MKVSYNFLFLGWWLCGQWHFSGGESYPKPSISVSPSEVVALAGNATIRCKSGQYPQHPEFYLIKEGAPHVWSDKIGEQFEAEFPIVNAKPSDAGIYRCQYHFTPYPHEWSVQSDHVYINITDPSLSKPTIKVRPREKLALGENVTIKCQGLKRELNFSLYKSKELIAWKKTKKDRNTTEFPFPRVSLEVAGNYTCQYHQRGNPFMWSEPSDPVELVVGDPSLSKPSIEVRPREKLAVGENVTIECQGPEKRLNFSLYKSKELIASKMTKKDRNTTEFLFSRVSLEVAGNYTCQYHRRGNPFVRSEPSDPVELVVTDTSKPAGQTTIIWASGIAGLLLLLLLLLLLAFLCYRKRRKGSPANERNQPVNKPLEPDTGAGPDEVSYAVLNHCSLQSKGVAVPDGVPETCVYASVVKYSTRKGQ